MRQQKTLFFNIALWLSATQAFAGWWSYSLLPNTNNSWNVPKSFHNPNAVETVDVGLVMKIRERFLYPQAGPAKDFPVFKLAENHIEQTDSTLDAYQVILSQTADSNTAYRFKRVAEVDVDNSVCMGSQTSFYFYIGMLTLFRDAVFDDETKDILYGAESIWARSGILISSRKQRPTDENTILPQIQAHRSEYYELMIYRFLNRNQRIDRWGDYYAIKGNCGDHDLGDYRDSWERVKPELEAYRAYLSGPRGDIQDFSSRVAYFTQNLPPRNIFEADISPVTSDNSDSSDEGSIDSDHLKSR